MHLDGIQRAEMRQSGRVGVVAFAIHIVFLVGHGADLFDQGFGVGLASALHVGVEEKIHGVELVAFATHVHGSGFAGSRDGGQV